MRFNGQQNDQYGKQPKTDRQKQAIPFHFRISLTTFLSVGNSASGRKILIMAFIALLPARIGTDFLVMQATCDKEHPGANERIAFHLLRLAQNVKEGISGFCRQVVYLPDHVLKKDLFEKDQERKAS